MEGLELNEYSESHRSLRTDYGQSEYRNISNEDDPEREPLIDVDRHGGAPYATVDQLGPWIPETDPKHPRANTLSVKLAQRHTMLKIQASISTVFAALSLGLMVWAITTFKLDGGIGTFMIGDCSQVQTWDSISHILLNTASTLFLGAGNYCMQILVSPSREEVDTEHKRGGTLDVGIHSFTNILKIARLRTFIWFALGVVSTSMHLLWNSTVFASIPITAYPVAIVTSDFQQAPDVWSVTKPYRGSDQYSPEGLASIYDLQDKAKSFTRLNNHDCIEAYMDPRKATSELVLVSTVWTEKNIRNGTASSWVDGWYNNYHLGRWDFSNWWSCQNIEKNLNSCPEDWADRSADSWEVYNQTIQYCLVGESGDNDSRCGLHFSRLIFIAVAISVSIGAGLVWWVAHLSKSPTFVTLGDAQASFLEVPDIYTRPTSADRNPRTGRPFAQLKQAEWQPVRLLWFNAVGSKMWMITITLFVAALTLGGLLFNSGVQALRRRGQDSSLSSIWGYGVGRVQAFALVGGLLMSTDDSTQDLVGQILFVNIFQVLISMLYLFCNNCLTCQTAANQWTHYMSVTNGRPNRKPLRVSSHVGLQRGTYMLSLPWLYACILIPAFATMHFLVARSCFLVRTIAFTAGPATVSRRLTESDASRVGFSTMGILLTTLAGVVVLVALLANSFRTYDMVPKYLARMAIKTAFIAAACQRPKNDADAHLFAVTFMAVDESLEIAPGNDSSIKRIVFSTDRRSEVPKIGQLYLQPIPEREPGDWKWVRMLLKMFLDVGSNIGHYLTRMWRWLGNVLTQRAE